MTDLHRLKGTSESQHTRALLRAAQSEAAPESFAEQLLLGVTGAAVTTSAATLAAAATAGESAASAMVQGTAPVGSAAAPSLALATAKWVGIGVLGGGILAAGANFGFSARHAAPAPLAAKVRVEPRAPSNRAAVAAAPDAPAPSTVATTSAVSAASAGPAPPPVGSTRSGQLGREVQIIDRVRRALAAGDTTVALAELDAYAKLTRTGVLDREARVLRIQALYLAGDTARAEQLTARYLNEFPNDALAPRLRPPSSSAPR